MFNKKIIVFCGGHGTGKTTAFNYLKKNAGNKLFISESQRVLENYNNTKHDDQKEHLRINMNVIELIVNGIISNPKIIMDRCIIDVLVYSYYFDNNFKFKLNRCLAEFLTNHKLELRIFKPNKDYCIGKRMSFDDSLRIYDLFINLEDTLFQILSKRFRLKLIIDETINYY